MEKKVFTKVDEPLYIEKLKNGIDVYLYNTSKTKNFYISISVKYGARVTKYKVGNKTNEVIPGSAHFLEHKVFVEEKNPQPEEFFARSGAVCNAFTTFKNTTYLFLHQ